MPPAALAAALALTSHIPTPPLDTTMTDQQKEAFQALEALTGIDYKLIHNAARKGHIYWNRYDVTPTFRVSKRDTIAWAQERTY